MPSVFHSSIFTLKKSSFSAKQAQLLAEKCRDQVDGIVSLHAGLSGSAAPNTTDGTDIVVFGLVVRVLTEKHFEGLRKHHAFVELINYLHHHSAKGKVSVDFASLSSNL
jgi:hypothetical protein